MSISSNRTFWLALTISLLLHAVLLIGVVSPVSERSDATMAVIRVEMARGSQQEANKTAVKSVPSPEPVVAPNLKPIPTPTPTPSPVSSPNPARPVQPVSAIPVIQAENGDSGKVALMQSHPAAERSARTATGKMVAGSATAPREGVSADEMRLYRVALASAARRFKRYPALARDRGWEGTADIALNVSSRPALPEVSLAKSSGQRILDEQALSMVSEAARVARLPEGLKGLSFKVVLPVQFSLDED